MSQPECSLFEVAVDRQVQVRLRKIPEKHRKQILTRIACLKETPRPHDSIKLKGDDGFRVDIGEYRILYDICYKSKLVYVHRLLQRGEGYGRHLK